MGPDYSMFMIWKLSERLTSDWVNRTAHAQGWVLEEKMLFSFLRRQYFQCCLNQIQFTSCFLFVYVCLARSCKSQFELFQLVFLARNE